MRSTVGPRYAKEIRTDSRRFLHRNHNPVRPYLVPTVMVAVSPSTLLKAHRRDYETDTRRHSTLTFAHRVVNAQNNTSNHRICRGVQACVQGRQRHSNTTCFVVGVINLLITVRVDNVSSTDPATVPGASTNIHLSNYTPQHSPLRSSRPYQTKKSEHATTTERTRHAA